MAAKPGFVRSNTANDDPRKATKLAKRFKQAMTLALSPEPVPVDPRMIAISMVNRLLAVHQVHNVILNSVATDGYDPNRPPAGILCEARKSELVKALVQHPDHIRWRNDDAS